MVRNFLFLSPVCTCVTIYHRSSSSRIQLRSSPLPMSSLYAKPISSVLVLLSLILQSDLTFSPFFFSLFTYSLYTLFFWQFSPLAIFAGVVRDNFAKYLHIALDLIAHIYNIYIVYFKIWNNQTDANELCKPNKKPREEDNKKHLERETR